MQISTNTAAYAAQHTSRMLAMMFQQPAGDAGQDVPSAASDSASTSATSQSGSTTPDKQFAADTLSSLLSLQEQPPSSTDIAGQMISQLDTDGDGSLSASEIQSAIGGDSTTDDISQAMSKLDTDGNGELSSSELAAGLDSAKSTHHGHGRHHHHVESADNDASSAAAASNTATDSLASTSSAAATSSASAVAVTTASDIDEAVAALAA